MRNQSVQRKILTSLGVTVMGYVLLITLVLWGTTRTRNFVDRSERELFPAALSSYQAQDGFGKAIRHFRDAVVMQDAKALAQGDADLAEVLNDLRDLREQTRAHVDRQEAIDQLMVAIASIRDQAVKTYQPLIQNPEAASAGSGGSVAALAQRNRETAAALEELRRDSVVDFQAQLSFMRLWSGRERLLSFAVLLVAMSWVAFSVVLLQRRIVRPIRLLSARLCEIAGGDGDLTQRLQVESTDELGEVANSFNLFVDHLQLVLREVSAGAIQLAGAAVKISDAADETVQRAGRQQGESEAISQAMDEMAGSVGEISRRSQKADLETQRALAMATDGSLAVRSTINTMGSIAAAVKTASEEIVQLGVRSGSISHIIGVIDDISHQVNLLALNAAIEAARAGEHGRSFSVVASELRTLSDRTASATRQISETLLLLRNGTDLVAKAMLAGSEEVRQGVVAATETGASLEEILSSISQSAAMITGVAAAAAQQATSTRHVNDNVHRITTLIHQSDLSARASAGASTELSQLARNLQVRISAFRLEGGPSGIEPGARMEGARAIVREPQLA